VCHASRWPRVLPHCALNEHTIYSARYTKSIPDSLLLSPCPPPQSPPPCPLRLPNSLCFVLQNPNFTKVSHHEYLHLPKIKRCWTPDCLQCVWHQEQDRAFPVSTRRARASRVGLTADCAACQEKLAYFVAVLVCSVFEICLERMKCLLLMSVQMRVSKDLKTSYIPPDTRVSDSEYCGRHGGVCSDEGARVNSSAKKIYYIVTRYGKCNVGCSSRA
jgi:hypothetical protein